MNLTQLRDAGQQNPFDAAVDFRWFGFDALSAVVSEKTHVFVVADFYPEVADVDVHKGVFAADNCNGAIAFRASYSAVELENAISQVAVRWAGLQSFVVTDAFAFVVVQYLEIALF